MARETPPASNLESRDEADVEASTGAALTSGDYSTKCDLRTRRIESFDSRTKGINKGTLASGKSCTTQATKAADPWIVL